MLTEAYLKYISIDGDDIGRKITSYYLSNNIIDLKEFSSALKISTDGISIFLSSVGFDILFCAADGVVASIDSEVSFEKLFEEIGKLAPEEVTFSAGVGENLREAYIALMSAKSNGKNTLHYYYPLV
jgi:hypothetical protein